MRERRGDQARRRPLLRPRQADRGARVGLEHNDAALDRDPFLLLAPEGEPPEVVVGPRIGITKAVDRPWRFSAAGSRFVSRPWPAAVAAR